MTSRAYNLNAELREEADHHTPKVGLITYKERLRLSHRDVVKSLDKLFGHKSVWNDDDGVWVNV